MTDYLALALRQEGEESFLEVFPPAEELNERAWVRKGILRGLRNKGRERLEARSAREEKVEAERMAAEGVFPEGTAEGEERRSFTGQDTEERSVLELALEPWTAISAEGELATERRIGRAEIAAPSRFGGRWFAEPRNGEAFVGAEDGFSAADGGNIPLSWWERTERAVSVLASEWDQGTEQAASDAVQAREGRGGFESEQAEEGARAMPNVLTEWERQRGATERLLRQVAQRERGLTVTENASGRSEREGGAIFAEPQAEEGLSLQGLDRAVERDARRYGGSFSLW